MSLYYLLLELKPILTWGRNNANPSVLDLALDETMDLAGKLDTELKTKVSPEVWERSKALMQFRLCEVRRLYNLDCLEQIEHQAEMPMFHRIHIGRVRFAILTVLCMLFREETIVYPRLCALLRLAYAELVNEYNSCCRLCPAERLHYTTMVASVNNITAYLLRVWA